MKENNKFEWIGFIFTVVASMVIGWCANLWWNDPANHRAPSVTHRVSHQTFRVTAYCPCSKCCGQFADGVTASGHKIKAGDAFVASPKSLPFGTMVTVPGYNGGQPVPVLDRGGAIKEGRMDVFFPTHQEALNWGVRVCGVEVEAKECAK